ncbi:MAG TPA: cysteine desulfurase family protein [Ktedonobacterales bacterium]|jgi:cysteine desulfurase|nr:cysteine desulfurase family protein [Ktedonobacterales bacterium]
MPLPDGTIYLDHAATTPTRPEVVDRMTPYFGELFGNPSSIYRLGRQSLAALDEAHESVARALSCRPTEVVFTGGGSEADNLAIKGVAFSKRRRGNHIITSAIEHHAVLHTCQQLEQEGYRVTYLPVDGSGLVDPAAVEEAITDETALVTLMYANNEIGSIQPIAEIGRICRARRIPLHTDAVQAGGLLDLDVTALNVDLLTLSAHKFYGPKGVGILYIRQGTRIQPQTLGGAQERNRRAGTENVPGAVGAAYALELARAERELEVPKLLALRTQLIDGILSTIPATTLTGHPEKRLPNNASFAFDGVEGESLLLNLDLLGVAASSGSACTTGSVEPSHVLTALGATTGEARGHLRLTLGHSSTEADVAFVLEQLPIVVERLRVLSTRPLPVESQPASSAR